jgi:hypothetical protein
MWGKWKLVDLSWNNCFKLLLLKVCPVYQNSINIYLNVAIILHLVVEFITKITLKWQRLIQCSNATWPWRHFDIISKKNNRKINRLSASISLGAGGYGGRSLPKFQTLQVKCSFLKLFLKMWRCMSSIFDCIRSQQIICLLIEGTRF